MTSLRYQPLGISPPVLAEMKDVTPQAVHLAIKRGQLVLCSERPKLITRESAMAWEPDRERQERGRLRNNGK